MENYKPELEKMFQRIAKRARLKYYKTIAVNVESYTLESPEIRFDFMVIVDWRQDKPIILVMRRPPSRKQEWLSGYIVNDLKKGGKAEKEVLVKILEAQKH